MKKNKKAATEEQILNGQPLVTKKEVEERAKEIEAMEANEPLDPNGYVILRHVDKVYDNGIQAVYDFSIDIKKHEFIVFVGPSGCGKSTTLRMIAGLEDITNGELYIDGEYANDKSPKDRDIAMVFQSYALYPHMTVYNNMAFGLKIRHMPKAEIDKRVHDAAKILQIEEYLDRKPKALSGGQRQRVALGRAIVRNAKVFLMDEPLSNLDAKLRVQMRSEIIKLHESLHATTIYVTHDQTEAMTMATRIVVMKLGHIQQIGTPLEIYNKPANVFVASFIGSPAMNLMRAHYKDGVLAFPSGETITLDDAFKQSYARFYAAEVESLKKEQAAFMTKMTARGQEILDKGGNPLAKSVQQAEHAVKVAKDDAARAEAQAKLDEVKATEARYASDPYQIALAADAYAKAKAEHYEKEIARCQDALKGESDIIFGLRPEDIHEGDEAHMEKYGGVKFHISVSVAELLGHEYYVHTKFGGIDDLVCKIPMVHEIKLGDEMDILFDVKKAHLFDAGSEKRIA